MSNALSCIVCGAPLQNVFPDSDNQPSGGTAFSTPGHYGSTFFDPIDGSRIEINVCDPCLVKNTDKIAWREPVGLTECRPTLIWPDDEPAPVASCDGRDCGGRPHE